MAAKVVYVGNDNLLELDGLQNATDSSYINNATVTVTVVDAEDNNVAGQAWPTTMTYVTSSNGKYRATLADGVSFVAGDNYIAQITADGGAGLLGFFKTPLVAVVRVDT